MTYDRPITIYTAGTRKATLWQAQRLLISELYSRIAVPVRSPESYIEYMSMKKPQQDDLKDVGGYVLGELRDGRRKAGSVLSREVLTLDVDNLPAGGADDILRRIDSLGCGYCVYSTRKHSPGKPRLRILLPLDRPVTADEYEAIARKAAQFIDPGMTPFDPTTFEPSRLMYWPSCCADGEYIYVSSDSPFISADGMLSTYADWHDYTSWPQVPGTQSHVRLAVKQGDPTEKTGVVGAFCRMYDVPAAMDRFLPGIYSVADENRYTFVEGSTTGGAVLYDDGKFLYSHHATDPCSGKLVNAFDLVRLHIYGDLDDDAKPDTPANRLPSYTEMVKLAANDPDVAGLMDREQLERTAEDFGTSVSDIDWMKKLARNGKGGYEKTIDNVKLILEHDEACTGDIVYDEFASRTMVTGAMPWDNRELIRPWDDADDAGARWYLEKRWHITGKEKILDAVNRLAAEHSYDPVKGYLLSLKWDGQPRIDTLYIDYLGAADLQYTRAAARKALCAAVARALCPGIKFDYMTVLTGKQGLGKSTLLRKLGKSWFTDAVKTFEGKEADEIIRGMWIVEIGELEAMNKSEVGRVKQVLSQTISRFRAAYGRNVQDCPRRCVFFGTSNNNEYLRDTTGGRRFWPIDVGQQTPTKSVFRDLDAEVDQIWAEAVYRYKQGESLYLSGDIEAHAEQVQEAHRERSPLEGLIAEWIEKPIPVDWNSWDLQRRRMYWGGGLAGPVETVQRQRVCAVEIWCELLDGSRKDLQRRNSIEINNCLSAIDGWEFVNTPRRAGLYGNQKCFERQPSAKLKQGY